MEWPEFLESSDSHEPTFDMFDDDYPEVTAQAVNKWTLEEKQFFERAFAMYYNQDSETLFEFVASKLPHKSMEEIKNHYLTLCQGIEMENNPPKNKDVFVVAVATAEDDHHQQELPQEVATLNGMPPPQVENNRPRRRRGIPWTQGEHQLFLMGLNRYGKGDWKSISRYYVVSKTPTQVASHAQKYFSRRNSKTPMGRRRASINDMQTVNLNPRRRPVSTVATTTHDQVINNAGGFAAYNNNHQAELSFHYPLGDPTFSNNNNVNGNFGRFYGGEASGSNSFVMGQNNNINLPRPVSPRPFLSTYLSSKGV